MTGRSEGPDFPTEEQITPNCALDWLIENELPLTVENYVGFNWCGLTFDDLEGEDRAEVERLVEEGLLTR